MKKLTEQRFCDWSEKPTTSKAGDQFLLAIDPGVSGWMAVVSNRGVHAVRPIPVHPVTSTKSRKVMDKEKGKKVTRKVEVVDNYMNYTDIARYLRYFRAATKRKTDKNPIVVFESVIVRPRQHDISTVKQHIGIQVWPIACACLGLENYEVPIAWKKAMKLDQDKTKSIHLLAEVCPKFYCGKSHDLAEACLLGYYYLRTEIND